MSRLGNILNAIVNPFGKQLWSGTWSSGTITVPDTAKYIMFYMDISGSALIAFRLDDVILGFGVAASGQAAQYIKAFRATISGNSWTFSNVTQTNHTGSTPYHSLSSTALEVRKIVGLIPNWGGLLKSIISPIHLHKEVLA